MTHRAADLTMAYRLRWKRRRLLFRAVRKRHQLAVVADRTAQIKPQAILAFATMRNEAQRLPHFLAHYRALGVQHFLIVDNGSDDGTAELLAAQPDVSLWRTAHSYKLSRFGIDWVTWLQIRYGHGHWCLTVDADEILIYPHHDSRPLAALTGWLDAAGIASFGAMMLDMYPKGPVNDGSYRPGDDPFTRLCWFDADDYVTVIQPKHQNLWVRGGPRKRLFFADQPARAPTLNKIPLVKWDRRFVYVTSTHFLLPRALNRVYSTENGAPSGILLHSKFLPEIVEKSVEEKRRQQHFRNSSAYDGYYDALSAGPDLWCAHSQRFENWQQLEALGLMSRGRWQ